MKNIIAEIVTCDICGSTKKVKSYEFMSMHKLNCIKLCEDCQSKCYELIENVCYQLKNSGKFKATILDDYEGINFF